MFAAARRTRASLIALAIAASVLPAACSTASSPPSTTHATSPSADNPSPAQTSESASPSPAPSPSASPSASAQKPVSAVDRIRKACPSVLSWDDFHRSDRSLHRDRLPTGQRYYASGPDPQLIRHNRLVSPGAAAPDILYVWLQKAPVTIAARWFFSARETSREHAVIGVAPRHAVIGHRHLLGFGIGSVQLAVYPDHWWFFYITDVSNSLQYHTVAMGSFSVPLRQDGHTAYRMAMRIQPKASVVTITYPGGRKTVQDPAFDQLWGRLFGIQVTRASNDGNVTYLAAASATAPCAPSSLLRLHHHR